MTIANPQLTRLSAVDVVLGSGKQTPNATISDGLLVTMDSTIDLDQLEENTQDDVISNSLGNRPTIIGSKAGSAKLNGNLASFGTKASKTPAIDPYLQMCAMSVADVEGMTLVSDATNLVYGSLIENAGATATGTVRGFKDGLVYFENTLGTFADGDVITIVTTGDAVGTIDSYDGVAGKIYKPDSNSSTVGEIFKYDDGARKALYNCAGNIEVNAESSKFAKFALSFMGVYDSDSWGDALTPTATYSDGAPALYLCSQIKFTFGTEFNPVNTSIGWNLGNVVAMRRDSRSCEGVAGFFVASRSDANGTVTIEEEKESVFPFVQKMLDSEVGTIDYNMTNGESDATIFFHQNINVTALPSGDDNGIKTYNMSLKAVDPDLNDGDTSIMFV